MTYNINGGRVPAAMDATEIVTFNDAEAVSPFELARQWADRAAWPMNRTASAELAELACMSALTCWLARWQPISIHNAILTGASVEAVCAALGGSLDETFRRWQEWATEQRTVILAGKPGVTEQDYATVARVFAAAGARLPDGECANG